MEIATLVSVLDHPHQAAGHLQAWGLADVRRGQQTLIELAECGMTLDLLATLCNQLNEHLPRQPDPDAALDAFRKFLFASRSPLAFGALAERDSTVLPTLLSVFAIGPRWQELIVADPEAFDLLRQTGGGPLARETLFAEVQAEMAAATDERSIAIALRRVRDRHTLRITYGEHVLRHKLELVAQQLTWLTEAIIAAALSAALRKTGEPSPLAAGRTIEPPVIAVVGLGRLGSAEMDYGDRLELLLIHEPPPALTDAARRAADEQAERVARQLLRNLSGPTDQPLYEVEFVALPDSSSPALMHTADDTVLGFDSFGRTWHRQALLRARPIAGDRDLAAAVLRRLEPWVYRRYLNRADETGIKALRRRIVRRPVSADNDPEFSRGGLADLEAVVQYLQLLCGGDRPSVRERGTLAAIAGLEIAGAITAEERTLLETNYHWLRQALHLRQVASAPPILDDAQLSERLSRTWEALSRLLDAESVAAPPTVVDLLLDPAPTPEEAAAALAGYGLTDPLAAAVNLQSLAQERSAFLSTRRCRHFLSLIIERLLAAIATTPDPDRTLDNLCSVSESLGAKGVLWELLNFHSPSLLLYVRLCAASPYLSSILTTSPGMLDDLIDSLQLDRLPDGDELERRLVELRRGVANVLPVLHDLKNSSHLRIGVRDILGQDTIEATHRSLADVAEFCLAQVVERELAALIAKFGQPTHGPGPFEGSPCRLAILGLGKLGGREPNYHSNLEVAFLYEAEGTTSAAPRSRQERTTNSHFFTRLAQRVLKELSQLTPQGRLYNVDVVLRPIGVGGALALPHADFANHFLGCGAPLWQWQTLCQARPVFGDPAARQAAANLIQQLLIGRPWGGHEPAELWRSRLALERGAAELNLKRGRGGTLDIEWLVQLLQLRHVAEHPEVLVPGTQPALAALAGAGCLDRDDAEYLAEGYRLLRRIESGLRLLNTTARHDLPENALELSQLALLLGQPNGDTLRDRTIMTLAENRRRFERILADMMPPGQSSSG
jgi:glutamate-ammonia-ligase adenylyltransferase